MQLVLAILLLLAPPSGASAARITGSVVDASGAPVPGASVTIVGEAAGPLTTGDDGTFTFEGGPDGPVTVRVVAPGFAEQQVEVTALDRVRIVLQPAPVTDAIVVTSSRGAARLATPASTSVITSAELLNTGAGALDDALRNTPGFSLFRRSSSRVSNPTTQGVTLRGLSGSGASRTMVLADGLPLNDAFGSWVYWNRVPQAAIERVEVIRGATGDLYGADALGGVVQVLTFAPGRTRLRATLDAGSHDTTRVSTFASARAAGWHGEAAGEWLRTTGVIVVGEESRGPIDTPADSDYGTGFVAAGYDAGSWHAAVRASLYDEERGNGTPRQVNTTRWKQLSGEAGGTAGGGAWLARAAGGTQTYYQTFTAVAADRRSERLTTEQTTPSDFASVLGQWTRVFGSATVLVGGEGKRTESSVAETRYSLANVASGPFFAGGVETSGALFGRVSFTPTNALTVVLGARGDAWRSEPQNPVLPAHAFSFFSPRASAAYRLNDAVSLHGSAYRAHRTPTLNELHRGFRVGNVVTNPNPQLDPESLTGGEGGVLVSGEGASARVTAFWNELDGAITNVTVGTSAAQITRQRQNTDTVRASGFEIEGDLRPHSRLTIGALAGVTRSTFTNAPAQPAIEGNRVPQVPAFQLGAWLTYTDPRGLTASVQARTLGAQFDDDLNVFELKGFTTVDASLSQSVRRGIHLFAAVENVFDEDYDAGRTPLRTIGWPRTARAGLRLFLP